MQLPDAAQPGVPIWDKRQLLLARASAESLSSSAAHERKRLANDQLIDRPYYFIPDDQVHYFAYRAHYQLQASQLVSSTDRQAADSSADKPKPPPLQRNKEQQRKKKKRRRTEAENRAGVPDQSLHKNGTRYRKCSKAEKDPNH